jgi:hypothetical protein
MESELAVSDGGKAYEILPINAPVGGLLFLLFLYMFFRHFLFALMVMDVIIGWLRNFSWFPKEGRRRRTFIHWVIAMALFWGFLLVAGQVGWMQFVPS